MESSKVVVVGSTLVFFITIVSQISSTSAIRDTSRLRTSTEFIRTSCSKTIYPQLCFSSLWSHASAIQTSPKLLAGEALNVTLIKVRATSSLMVRLSKIAGLKPREVGAMADCVEVLGDAVDEIRRSIAELDGPTNSFDFQFMISDVQTWVSAALTDETTCTDGFAGNAMNGKLKVMVRNHIVELAHMTSNTLALINAYALQV